MQGLADQQPVRFRNADALEGKGRRKDGGAEEVGCESAEREGDSRRSERVESTGERVAEETAWRGEDEGEEDGAMNPPGGGGKVDEEDEEGCPRNDRKEEGGYVEDCVRGFETGREGGGVDGLGEVCAEVVGGDGEADCEKEDGGDGEGGVAGVARVDDG